MRIAVMSDIHGNNVALKAVLKDLAGQGQVNQIIVAGDFFAPSSETTAILSTLWQLPKVYFLRGNADRYLLENSYSAVYSTAGWQGELRQSFQWTAQRLGRLERYFLTSLPFSQVVPIGNRQLLAVHGSPRSDEEGLTSATTAEEFARMPIEPEVALLICGHTHIPMDRIINGVRVVNVGSVGIPFDGDPRASYAVITTHVNKKNRGGIDYTPDAIQVELRRVGYDVERAVEQLYAVNHPAAALGAYNMRNGCPRGINFKYAS